MKLYYQDELITLYYGDAAKIVPQLKTHSLLLTDPPYGLGEKIRLSTNTPRTGEEKIVVSKFNGIFWDDLLPQWLIDTCIAKCGYAIIFGGNYYHLPPAKCWLIWDKRIPQGCTFPPCEIAWTNLNHGHRLISHLWHGLARANNEKKYHPTQKPLKVIRWAMKQAPLYPFSSILDPFAGSGTTLVAARIRKLKATGIEISQEYCDIIVKRLSYWKTVMKSCH